MKIYSKESLTDELKKIAEQGWIRSVRQGNDGAIGNTLEDLLGIKENNLPIPNASEWELKAQRLNSSSLTTLFHIEPSPRAIKFIPAFFLLNYGWLHKEAGKKYPHDEMSFRQTIHGLNSSDRGFQVIVDKENKKVVVSFDKNKVSHKHHEWLKGVEAKVGLKELEPQPYWGFDDLSNKAGTKLLNCFYVQAEVKKRDKIEFYKYTRVMMLSRFNFECFLAQIENGNILVDFDARTGHNHGTKFRMRQKTLPYLYEESQVIL